MQGQQGQQSEWVFLAAKGLQNAPIEKENSKVNSLHQFNSVMRMSVSSPNLYVLTAKKLNQSYFVTLACVDV